MIGTPLDERDNAALPVHFHEPLRLWCQDIMTRYGMTERIHLRVRVGQLRVPIDLLPSVRAILELGAEEATAVAHDSGWYTSGVRLWSLGDDMFDVEAWREQVLRLGRILQDGGSIWELTADAAGLQLRVSPAENATLQAAAQAARNSPRPAAADDLTKAWKTA